MTVKPSVWDWLPEEQQKLFRPMRKGLWLVGGAAIQYDRELFPDIAKVRDWDYVWDHRVDFQRVHLALFANQQASPRITWSSSALGAYKGMLNNRWIDVFPRDCIGTYLSTLPLPRHGIVIELATGMVLRTREYQCWAVGDADCVITTRPVYSPDITSKNRGDLIDREPEFQI